MPTYHVAHKIRTVAELYDAQTIDGLRLTPFDPDAGPTKEAWEAVEILDAQDFLTAFNASRARLLPLIDALAVITQCAFSLSGMSFQVYRLTENPENVLYFCHIRGCQTVGMTLWKPEQLKDVSALLKIESPAALRYFREAINAVTSSACLAMMVTTAESLAGQTVVTGKCQNCGYEHQRGGTDREDLVAVLGDEIYNQLYKKSSGSLRNKLLHGSAIDENAAAALCTKIYERILAHLGRVMRLASIYDIEGAPRRFDSLQWYGTFLRWNSTAIPLLRDLETKWQTGGDRIDQPQAY